MKTFIMLGVGFAIAFVIRLAGRGMFNDRFSSADARRVVVLDNKNWILFVISFICFIIASLYGRS